MSRDRKGPPIWRSDMWCGTMKLAREIAKSLDTSTGRKLAGAIGSHVHSEILAMPQPNPLLYSNPDLFSRDWLAYNLLRKYPKLDIPRNREGAAMGSFFKGENQCVGSNRRLGNLPFYLTNEWSPHGVSLHAVIHAACRKIVGVIGEAPDLDLVARHAGFSNGASTRLKRVHADPLCKLGGRIHVTPRAYPYVEAFVRTCPSWARELRRQFGCNTADWFQLVGGNVVTCVPKNAKTDRTIAIEPEGNMLLQLGVGRFLKGRLLSRAGIDLYDQSINQRLAHAGSVDDSIATLDLENASNSVSIGCVRALLPAAWFGLLDDLRSHFGDFRGSTWAKARVGKGLWRYSMFSSMGNGFTFELESLIFWALSSSVVELYCGDDQPLSVYGDDIIVPKRSAGHVVEVLAFFGFNVNNEKSFVSGPFRESCGKHYFRGVDVTPFYIDEPINRLHHIFLLGNQLRRWAARATSSVCDPRYLGAYRRIVSCVSPNYRFLIPEGAGDGGFIGTPFEPGFIRGRMVIEVTLASSHWFPDELRMAGQLLQRLSSNVSIQLASNSSRSGPVLECRVIGGYIPANRARTKMSIKRIAFAQWESGPIWPVDLQQC